ncbi:MAG: sugar kinase, partial [Coriobacteriia bacterium]|nr:sugar kinase [Coriobacteriia bacterium]
VDDDGSLRVGETTLRGCQGSAAMLLAAAKAAQHAGAEPPHALLGGDVGRGEGTRGVYERLAAEVARIEPTVVAFHYLQPVMALMREAVNALESFLGRGVRLVADAGGMYAARASGVGGRFELMTPDVGEVGFLADESVSHPAYVSRYLFGTEDFDPVALACRAQEGLAARVLLVKGSTDHVVEEGCVRGTVSEPLVPELEAIGGTGDMVTGLASALMAAGRDTVEAAMVAARANREAGRLLGARPDHTPSDLARHFPQALALAEQ